MHIHQDFPELPVVLLTGLNDAETDVQALRVLRKLLVHLAKAARG